MKEQKHGQMSGSEESVSNSFPAVNEEAVLAWVGPQGFQLGRSHFEDGAILDPRLQGNTLKALCQDTMFLCYTLWVVYSAEGIEEGHCSCPAGGGGRCEHIGALLHVWLDNPRAFRAVEELDTNLERRSRSELIGLVKKFLQVDPELEFLLDMVLPAGDHDRALANPEIYRRQVSHAFSRGGDDWHAGRRIAADLGMVVNIGNEFLDILDHVSAGIVYRAVLQGIWEHYETISDEGRYLWGVMARCIEGLEDCLAAEDSDVAVRAKCLQDLFGTYRFDVGQGGSDFGEVAKDIMLGYATSEEKNAIAGWVRTAMSEGEGSRDKPGRQLYGAFLLELEADHLDDEVFLEICRESGRLIDLVDRLLTLERLDEALAEADRAGDAGLWSLMDKFREHDCTRELEPLVAKRIEATGDLRLMEWLRDRYKKRGELAGALALAQRLLKQRPDLAGYRYVRDLSRRLGVWQEVRSELLAEWATARAYGLLTDAYLDEGETGLALKLVRQHEQVFPFGSDRLIRVAQAAAETHPQASVEIYREQVEKLIEARRRDLYQQACVYLTRMRDLHRQMSRDPEWNDFMAEFRERHQRLSALQDELDNAGL